MVLVRPDWHRVRAGRHCGNVNDSGDRIKVAWAIVVASRCRITQVDGRILRVAGEENDEIPISRKLVDKGKRQEGAVARLDLRGNIPNLRDHVVVEPRHARRSNPRNSIDAWTPIGLGRRASIRPYEAVRAHLRVHMWIVQITVRGGRRSACDRTGRFGARAHRHRCKQSQRADATVQRTYNTQPPQHLMKPNGRRLNSSCQDPLSGLMVRAPPKAEGSIRCPCARSAGYFAAPSPPPLPAKMPARRLITMPTMTEL
jgi:hypothetical protein